MKRLNTVLVDDEKSNLELLSYFLTKYCPMINTTKMCVSYEEALETLSEAPPQLLFLDIMLDKGTSFDLLKEIDLSQTQIIFVTAYDEHAIEAFKYNTVDYLLKPIQIEELIIAVGRAYDRITSKDSLQHPALEHLEQAILDNKPLPFVTISNVEKVHFVKNQDILYCKSSGRYTEFHLTNNKRLVASKTLGDYESILQNEGFYRIHNSFMVNLAHIVSIDKKGGNYCILNNEARLPISRRRMEGLIQYLKVH